MWNFQKMDGLQNVDIYKKVDIFHQMSISLRKSKGAQMVQTFFF